MTFREYYIEFYFKIYCKKYEIYSSIYLFLNIYPWLSTIAVGISHRLISLICFNIYY